MYKKTYLLRPCIKLNKGSNKSQFCKFQWLGDYFTFRSVGIEHLEYNCFNGVNFAAFDIEFSVSGVEFPLVGGVPSSI